MSLGTAACAQGCKFRFFHVTELIAFMLEAPDEWALPRLRSQLAKCDLIVLDELGDVGESGSRSNS